MLFSREQLSNAPVARSESSPYSIACGVVPGVVFESSGAEGLISPFSFSGVVETTFVGPGPAVAGLSPFGPEGCAAPPLLSCSSLIVTLPALPF